RAVDSLTQEGGAYETTTRSFRFASEVQMEARSALVERLYRAQKRDEDPDLTFTRDDEGLQLILTGPRSVVDKVQRLFDLVGRDRGTTGRETRVLEFADRGEMERISKLLQSVYESEFPPREGKKDRATFVPDPKAARLLVSASSRELRRLEVVLATLKAGRPATGKAERATEYFSVREGTASDRKSIVERIYKAQTNGLNVEADDLAVIDADNPGRRLIVTASPAEMKRVRTIIEGAFGDRSTGPKRETRVFRVRRGDASDMSSILTTLYEAETIEEPEGGRANITPRTAQRQIVVVGPEAEVARVEALLRQLDPSSDAKAGRGTKSIDVRRRQVREILPLIQSIYDAETRGADLEPEDRAAISADPSRKRLLVTGSAEEIRRVERIVREIDPSAQRTEEEQTRIVRLKNSSPSEIQPLLDSTLNPDPERPRVRIRGDERSRALILSGFRDVLDTAGRIVSELDRGPESDPVQMRIIPWKAGDVSKGVSLVEEVFRSLLRNRRGANAEVRARLIPDEGSRRVIILAPADELELLQGVVEQVNVENESASKSRVYELKHATASQLAEAITQAMMKRTSRGREEPGVRVSVQGPRRLLVAGDVDSLLVVDHLVEKLDAPVESRVALRVFDLRQARATELAPLVGELWSAQHPSRSTESLSVKAGPDGRRLFVVASSTDVDAVEKLIRELEGTKPLAKREFRTLKIESGTAAAASDVLERLYRSQYGDDPRPAPTITPDTNSPRLLIVCDDVQFERLSQLLETYQAGRTPEKKTSSIIELRDESEVARVLPLLEKLYPEELKSRSSQAPPEAKFLRDRNRLIVTGTELDVSVVNELLERLRASPEAESRTLKTYELRDAAELARVLPSLRSLYSSHREDADAPLPPAAEFLEGPTPGRLLVKAVESEQVVITTLLEALRDSAPGVLPELGVFELSAQDATTLAPIVRSVFETTRPNSSVAGTPVSIEADGNANRLVVTASKTDLSLIASIVEQLDKTSELAAGTRIFRLKFADAEKIAGILTKSMVDRVRGREFQRVSVSFDLESNSLVLSGSTRDLQAAALIVEELDGDGAASERKLEFVEISSTDAESFAQLAQSVWADRTGGRDSKDVSIRPDPRGGRLVLVAESTALEAVTQLIAELDNVPASEALVVRIVPLENREASELAPIVGEIHRQQSAKPETVRASVLAEPG
ncbi:MAG: secretin N-terminal domain-containing protein, partial [Planctomycetota bacterium]